MATRCKLWPDSLATIQSRDMDLLQLIKAIHTSHPHVIMHIACSWGNQPCSQKWKHLACYLTWTVPRIPGNYLFLSRGAYRLESFLFYWFLKHSNLSLKHNFGHHNTLNQILWKQTYSNSVLNMSLELACGRSRDRDISCKPTHIFNSEPVCWFNLPYL